MEKKKLKNCDFKKMLKDLYDNRDNYETYELIYIQNLLENGIIDSFKKGKITREKMEHYLFDIHTKIDQYHE